ncbi:MAG: hypothetical protein AAB863_01050, partial [Patescibacteria group bacterium]
YQAPMPEQKHFLNKKFIVTFVILALLGTGAYAGIWWWGNQQQSDIYTFEECTKAKDSLMLETYPEQCVTKDGQTFVNPDQKVDPTEGWQTYRNDQYGFEFKYPNNLEITNIFDKKDFILNPDDPASKPFDWFSLHLSDQRESQIFNFSMEINNPGTGFEGSEIISKSIISINGIQVEKQVLQVAYGEDKGSKSALYIFSRLGNGYMIYATDTYELADTILSTFKFIDSYVQNGTGTLSGHVDIGPNCPVEQVGVSCTPAPEAYTSRQVFVYKADGTTLMTTQNFDMQGNYSIALPAETYIVKSKTGIGSAVQVIGVVTIKNGKTTTLNFSIDTGIR